MIEVGCETARFSVIPNAFAFGHNESSSRTLPGALGAQRSA